jgi:glutathione S-transferase
MFNELNSFWLLKIFRKFIVHLFICNVFEICFRYEEINVNLVDKPEWYLKKNAPGQVPALEWIDNNTKETRFIPESLIVSDYLDENYSENRLQPTDPFLKAKQRVLVERFSNVNKTNSHFNVKHFYFRLHLLFIKLLEEMLSKVLKI